jgi:hypothetical protein
MLSPDGTPSFLFRLQVAAGNPELSACWSDQVTNYNLDVPAPSATVALWNVHRLLVIGGRHYACRAATGLMKYLKFEGHYHALGDQTLVSFHPAAGEGEVGRRRIPVSGRRDNSPTISLSGMEQPRRGPACLRRTWFRDVGKSSASRWWQTPMHSGRRGISPIPPCETATRYGALLMFDEVITGLRLETRAAPRPATDHPGFGDLREGCGRLPSAQSSGGPQRIHAPTVSGEVVHAGTFERKSAHRIRRASRDRRTAPKEGHDLSTRAASRREARSNYRGTLASDKQKWSDFVLALLDEKVVILPDGRWTSPRHVPRRISIKR